MSDPLMLDFAIDYARENGWPVFPCDPATKKPLTKNGFKDATTDPEQISAWWHRHPDAMIGVPTGKKTGIVVLDVDVDPDKGIDGREALVGLEMPRTLSCRTPRGGIHVYFQYPDGHDIGNSAGQLGVGLDVRGEGGYVIVPPSINAAGKAYEWTTSEGTTLPPSWFSDKARPKERPPQPVFNPGDANDARMQPYGDVALARTCDEIAFAPVSQRHMVFMRVAPSMFGLVKGGYSTFERVREHLRDAGLASGRTAKEVDVDLRDCWAYATPRGPKDRPDWKPQAQRMNGYDGGDPGHQGDQQENEQQKPQEIEPFPTVRASSFEGLAVPEVEFLDQRKLLPMGNASLLTGATKVGKTYVALQASVACVTGTKWLNEHIRQGPVIFYSAEESIDIIHYRLSKICEGEVLSFSQLHDLHIVNLSEIVDAALVKGDNRTESIIQTDLYKRLDASMSLIKPVVAWVDNKGLAVTGNENSRSMSAAAARAFQVLAHRHNCAVVMLMHPSNTGEANETGASGSTAHFAGYRSVLHMKRSKEEGEKDVRVLENALTNYAEGGTVVNMKWDFGRYICTDIPIRAGSDIGILDKAERVFMKLMRWHAQLKISLSPFRQSPDYPPKVFNKMARDKREGLNTRWFEQAMESLLEKRKIGPVEGRKNGRKIDVIVELSSTT